MVSPISNPESANSLMDICYDFFFNWQTEKKNCFGQKFVFFINCSTEKNTWKKMDVKNW